MILILTNNILPLIMRLNPSLFDQQYSQPDKQM
jgi:hypothetical protein